MRFTPTGAVDIKTTKVYTYVTIGTNAECGVCICDNAGGLPGTEKYRTTFVGSHDRWSYARITPPVTVDADFWIVVELPRATVTSELGASSDEGVNYGTRNAAKPDGGSWRTPSGARGDFCIRVIVSGSGVEQELYPAEIVTLNQNFPNPVVNGTAISYMLSQRTGTELAIYDVTGKLVRSLVNDVEESGMHKVMWDRRDNHGERVHSGVYFYRLDTKTGGSFTKVMTVL